MMSGANPKRRKARALQDAVAPTKASFGFREVLECVRFAPLWLLAIALMITTRAADSSADFDAANRLYEKGDYGSAVSAYEKLTKSGSASPALLFNLGNAFFKNGQVGRAIAAYREAEHLDPRDPDIRANLKFVLGSVPGNNARVSAIDRALDLLTLNERGFWTALALWIWFGSLALAQIRPTLKNNLRTVAAGAAIFAICFGLWYAQGLIEHATERKVVVIAPTAAVRFGPLEESQVSFNVRDGNELRLLGTKDKWLQVADASNRSGWIPENDVARLP
jgi:tetratricopeptide (TPR) repeat protein